MSNQDWYLYTDSIHGIQAAAPTRSMAWALIRNECHSKQIEVPTMDKIIEVRKLSEAEIQELKTSKP